MYSSLYEPLTEPVLAEVPKCKKAPSKGGVPSFSLNLQFMRTWVLHWVAKPKSLDTVLMLGRDRSPKPSSNAQTSSSRTPLKRNKAPQEAVLLQYWDYIILG